jgi:uncharacterized membrane protein (DUF373 family)
MNEKLTQFIARSEKFLTVVNILLAAIIAIVLVFAVGLLFFDIISMIKNKYAQGIGTVLGSLIIIWVVLELLEAQIDHIKGKKLNASIFVVVAIVAFIKKLLVASLMPDKAEFAYFNLAVILGLSITFLILQLSESRLGPKG